jgi:GAF domain-containing protein
MIADAQNDLRFLKVADNVTGFSTRSILSVPLLYEDVLLGVLNVLNGKSRCGFETEDKEILLSYASLAATAIVRSRLFLSHRVAKGCSRRYWPGRARKC